MAAIALGQGRRCDAGGAATTVPGSRAGRGCAMTRYEITTELVDALEIDLMAATKAGDVVAFVPRYGEDYTAVLAVGQALVDRLRARGLTIMVGTRPGRERHGAPAGGRDPRARGGVTPEQLKRHAEGAEWLDVPGQRSDQRIDRGASRSVAGPGELDRQRIRPGQPSARDHPDVRQHHRRFRERHGRAGPCHHRRPWSRHCAANVVRGSLVLRNNTHGSSPSTTRSARWSLPTTPVPARTRATSPPSPGTIREQPTQCRSAAGKVTHPFRPRGVTLKSVVTTRCNTSSAARQTGILLHVCRRGRHAWTSNTTRTATGHRRRTGHAPRLSVAWTAASSRLNSVRWWTAAVATEPAPSLSPRPKLTTA